MVRRKDKAKRQRKPLYVFVCEGRNETEKLYFSHFNRRENPYVLKCFGSEATDIGNMVRKAMRLYGEYEMDPALGDKMFCVIDMDLNEEKYEKYKLLKTKHKNVVIVVSNPCFETWLSYYFTESPKVVNSSQKAKDELKYLVPGYSENMDIVKECDLESKHGVAINRSEKKNRRYNPDSRIIDRNPYSEVQDPVTALLAPFADEDE